jgi:uncharacterized NAD(P)/FAD-binding protein YdhS
VTEAAEPFDVVIIGGGAAGVLVAIHLLEVRNTALRIAIVEPRPALAQGAAYSTNYPEHLLNVIESRMSAFDTDSDHFARFMAASEDLSEFVPASGTIRDGSLNVLARRLDFGRYLLATLEQRASHESLQWLRDEAIDVDSIGVDDNGVGCNGPYSVKLAGGDTLRARHVVLAVGNFPRALPLPASAIHGEPRIDSAWNYAAVRGIDPACDVCIIGSGLSMIDAVISLAQIGHHGRITVLSRHGLMPLPHARHGSQEGDVDDLRPLSLRARMRILRSRAAEAMKAGEPWQWTMDQVRYHVQSLWRSLSDIEQRRFLRHGARFWDIHRHRIAPSVAATLDAMRSSGQLVIHAAHLVSIVGEGSQISVVHRRRGEQDNRELHVDRVLNSTGVESNIRRMDNRLLRALLARGTIVLGKHGIGVATDDSGALLNADGIAQPDLLTIGALRIGQLWESIAIPELRVHAEDISRRLLGRIAL